jgi:hypothetical protein
LDEKQAAAFEAFVNESGGALMRTAVFLTCDPHAAEDVYQETMHQLSARWAKGISPGTVKSTASRAMADSRTHPALAGLHRREPRREPVREPELRHGHALGDAGPRLGRRVGRGDREPLDLRRPVVVADVAADELAQQVQSGHGAPH